MQHFVRGEWLPYESDVLLDLLTSCFLNTPEYCRLTRVVRDISSTDIVAGDMKPNFRQVVEARLRQLGRVSPDIRGREIRGRAVSAHELVLDELWYETGVSREVFIQFITAERRIAGFLRLSLPTTKPFIEELNEAAIIREVHVYGQAVSIGQSLSGKAQHAGLGKELIDRAATIAAREGYGRLAVISAVGTREYYRKRGFTDGDLYQFLDLTTWPGRNPADGFA